MYTNVEMAAVPQDDLLIFLHIPKTAGTTLSLILKNQYLPHVTHRTESYSQVADLTPQQRRDMRLLLGHFPFGSHQYFSQPATYITLLRDPVERVLSRYCHVLRDLQGDHPSPQPRPWETRDLSLSDYLRLGFGESDNWQTRMLAGPAAEAGSDACDREIFEQAKRNLTTRFAVAGLTERFEETVVLLQRRFGWSLSFYGKENVGANRLDRTHVPEDVMEVIQQQTRWDRELYAFAAARFEEQCAQEGAGFANAVRQLRQTNARCQRMSDLAGHWPLRVLKQRLPLAQKIRLGGAVRSAVSGSTFRGC